LLGNIGRKKIRIVLIVWYTFFILYLTLLSREFGNERLFTGPFWEVCHGYWGDIGLNILLFIPLGIIAHGLKHAFLYGLCLSMIIESVQFTLRLGMCQVDDVINNSIGMVVGILIAHQISIALEKD
jgi:glycopeptide antibiotics resistance protein